MNCAELLAAVNQYVDGELDPGICDSFQEHLKDCNPCQVVVDNIRQTITLYRAGQHFDLPATLHERLARVLRERWNLKLVEDQPLVARAKAGDFAAMESLLVRYERQVFGLARRIVGQHQDAEEITQQTFLSVIEHLGDFRAESQFRTWLLRIATNHAWLCCASVRYARPLRSTIIRPTKPTRGCRIPSSLRSGARRRNRGCAPGNAAVGG